MQLSKSAANWYYSFYYTVKHMHEYYAQENGKGK